MFRLLKWVIIISAIIFIYYLVGFFKAMNEQDVSQVKKDAITAIESGDVHSLVDPLADRVKEDLLHKKANLFESLRQKLKDVLPN